MNVVQKVPSKGFPCPGWVQVVRAPLTAAERVVMREGESCRSPAMVHRLLAPRLNREVGEVMIAIGVDGRNRVRYMSEVSRGGLHGLAVSARDILRPMVAVGASAFVLVHNHPSGDPTPSLEDIAMTRAVQAAADVVGTPLLDHVILTVDAWSSLRELGLMGS